MTRGRLVTALLCAGACSAEACSAAKPPESGAERSGAAGSPRSAAPTLTSPARWGFLEGTGVTFDEASEGTEVPRAEPALVGGVRVMLTAGIVVGSAPRPEALRGFRSLPARLGGGFVLWSDARTYLARSFLGPLRTVAEVGAEGGARPWMSSVLFRTPAGLFAMDPRVPGAPLTRAALPGIVDALAVDERRAVKLDHASRASYTTDGGATWTDVLATRGVLVQGLASGRDGEVVLDLGGHLSLVLGKTGALAAREPQAEARGDAPPVFGRLASSRALPTERLAQAILGGAAVPGGRLLVAREGGVALLARETGLPLADADLPAVDARFARCQAVAEGAEGGSALACVADTGAVVLGVDGALTHLTLEATFPTAGAAFFGGPSGQLAFDGRCGGDPPNAADLGPPNGAGAMPKGGDEPPAADEAWVCVRGASGHWAERHVSGDDARNLYRWIPGNDADAIALVLAPASDAPSPQPTRASEGVRVVRVDPNDPALGTGAFVSWTPELDAPRDVVDRDAWIDPDGAVRAWVLLRGESDKAEGVERVPRSEQGPARRLLPLVTHRGGRVAGVRIDARGHVTRFALPEGTVEVVRGGPFALAMAKADDETVRWFETIDGGATWTPIDPPPVGELEAPSDDSTPFGCSALGCTLGGGIVRLGWGGPPSPAELAPEPAAAHATPAPRLATIECSVGDASTATTRTRKRTANAPQEPVLAISSPLAAIPLDAGVLALSPFDPFAAPRRVAPPEGLRRAARAARAQREADEKAEARRAVLVPYLRAKTSRGEPRVDTLLRIDPGIERGAGRFTRVGGDRLVAAAELVEGGLVALDAEHGALWLVKGDRAAVAMHVARAADVTRTRLTLARRADGRPALAAYSTRAGELFVADLDLARAEVGPLAALGRLDALAPPSACPRPTHHAVLELPVHLVLHASGAAAGYDDDTTASVLVAAGPDAVCAEAIEITIRGTSTVLRASLRGGGAVSVTDGTIAARGRCRYAPAP